jgi:hypothetical protein
MLIFVLMKQGQKLGVWAGGILAAVFVFFRKPLEIDKEQSATLGDVWGLVVAKWYPDEWLNKTEQAGDAVSAFEPEKNAVYETWNIFGDRIINKKSRTGKSEKVEEIVEQSDKKVDEIVGNSSEIVESSTNDDDGVNFPPTMGVL